MKDFASAKRIEERKQQVAIERLKVGTNQPKGEVNMRGYWTTEDARVKCVPKWSDVCGSSKSPTSNGGCKSSEKEKPQQILRKAPPSYKATAPPFQRGDARVEELSRRLKNALLQLQVENEIIQVVELSQRRSRPNRFRIITGEPNCNCKVRLALPKKRHIGFVERHHHQCRHVQVW